MNNSATRHDWFETPLGTAILTLEKQQLKHWLAAAFGYHLLAISDHLQPLDLRTSKIPHRFISQRHFSQSGQGQLCLDAADLPFADDSIDCLLLHHQLEFAQDPLQLLREAERVLISHGQLILIGFNPHSLLGLAHCCPRKNPTFPWSGRFYSLRTLKQWLDDSALCIEATQHFFYKPPSMHATTLKKWQAFDRLGAKLWPAAGGVYAVRIRKKTPCFIPLQLKSKRHASSQVRGTVIDYRCMKEEENAIKPTDAH